MGLLGIPVRTDWVVRAVLYWIHPLWSFSFPIIDQMRNPAQAATEAFGQDYLLQLVSNLPLPLEGKGSSEGRVERNQA